MFKKEFIQKRLLKRNVPLSLFFFSWTLLKHSSCLLLSVRSPVIFERNYSTERPITSNTLWLSVRFCVTKLSRKLGGFQKTKKILRDIKFAKKVSLPRFCFVKECYNGKFFFACIFFISTISLKDVKEAK